MEKARNIGHWGFWVGRECNSILEQKLAASLTCLLWGHNIRGPSTQNMSWMELWIFTKNLWNFTKSLNWGNDSFSPCSARKCYKYTRLRDVLSLPLVEYVRVLQATYFIPVILRKLLNANKYCFTYTCEMWGLHILFVKLVCNQFEHKMLRYTSVLMS